MDALPCQKPVRQTRHEGQQALTLLKSAHTKNDTRTFEDLLTKKLQLAELKPIWPALMKMTIYHMPIDESIPSHNPKFSQLLNDYSKQHESPIHKSARSGALAKLNTLLTKDTLNAQNLNGETPLFAAVFAEQFDIAQMLLQAKADPLIEIAIGMAPFSISNSAEMTQLLYAHGASAHLNHQDVFGQTPLFHAIQRGNTAVAALLIDLKAQVNLGNMCGEVVLHGTSSCDALKLSEACTFSKKLLESGANVNAQSNDLRTPLHIAAQDRLVPLIHLFLTHGADTTLKDRWDRTPASLIQEAWGVAPEEFIAICSQPNGKEILSCRARAIAQKSFEYTPATQKMVKPKNKDGKSKKKKKQNFPTFNQRKGNTEAVTAVTVPARAVISPLVITPSPVPLFKQVATLILADRVTRWQNPEWLLLAKQNAKRAGVYKYWQFKRKRLYHRLPERTLCTLLEHGTPELRPNQTHDGQMDTQYVLEGEMQFENLTNPWNPGKQRQPGFYHMTRGIDDKIYHVGFKPIQNRGLRLADFMPQEEIPVLWADAKTDSYSAAYDPDEGVRHVLYLKK